MAKKRLGLIVNPIAGIGGRVGLHGSDGVETQQRALALGAVPEANRRAVEALARLDAIREGIEVVTCPAEMGEEATKSCGFSAEIVGVPRPSATTAQDTWEAVEEMRRLQVDLLLFAGGDGTARDVCRAAGDGLTVLGIPAGVKIHSAVFAVNARSAGDLAVSYLRGNIPRMRQAEVVDIEEELFRRDIISTKLFGYLTIPAEPRLLQGAKTPSRASEQESLAGIAAHVAAQMNEDTLYIIGPGTTTRAIADKLSLNKTLIGVDVVHKGEIIAADANEQELLRLLAERSGKIIVTPVGGQGCLFGRGNQQLSPAVIKRVGKDNIVVVATPDKIQALAGRPFWVDTGDQEVDRMLAGYVRVITGLRESAIYQVSSGSG
jgi:predicted polyphosphate/ATP-dependent NAD kinase